MMCATEIERRILFELTKMNSNITELKRLMNTESGSNYDHTNSAEEVHALTDGPVNHINNNYINQFKTKSAQGFYKCTRVVDACTRPFFNVNLELHLVTYLVSLNLMW